MYPYGSKHCLIRYLNLKIIVNYAPVILPKKVRLDLRGHMYTYIYIYAYIYIYVYVYIYIYVYIDRYTPDIEVIN